jgi:hypothetical protein
MCIRLRIRLSLIVNQYEGLALGIATDTPTDYGDCFWFVEACYVHLAPERVHTLHVHIPVK